MKYIVLQVSMFSDMTVEIPIVFPENLVHSVVAEGFIGVLQKHYPEKVIRPIAAGFVTSTVFGGQHCYGESETLKMSSRGGEDDRLLMMADYGGCIK